MHEKSSVKFNLGTAWTERGEKQLTEMSGMKAKFQVK